jgi:UDP-2,3-diacylglucosamine pyrophosphatase LpxH
MSVIGQELVLPQTQLRPQKTRDRWQTAVEHRLTTMQQRALHVAFDDTSRFVFFSDCHRGDNGRSDAFSKNEKLFIYALEQYATLGYTYVEVGDGDELWQNPQFDKVFHAHPRTFNLLHRLHVKDQLYMLLGNHDIQNRHTRFMHKDGIPVYESIILKHVSREQNILVFHGHQTDPFSDIFALVSRFLVRHVWRQLLQRNLVKELSVVGQVNHRHLLEESIHSHVKSSKMRIEQRLTSWAQENQQMIICGHTHRAKSAHFGYPPYFNTGSCVAPNQMTGMEICDGFIKQVRWVLQRNQVYREELDYPQRLLHFMRS